MKRFFHLAVSPSAAKRTADIERVLDRVADDWFRYAPNCWILWTDRTAAQLSRSIRRQLKSADEALVFPLDMTTGYAGYMDPSFWEWLQKPRT